MKWHQIDDRLRIVEKMNRVGSGNSHQLLGFH